MKLHYHKDIDRVGAQPVTSIIIGTGDANGVLQCASPALTHHNRSDWIQRKGGQKKGRKERETDHLKGKIVVVDCCYPQSAPIGRQSPFCCCVEQVVVFHERGDTNKTTTFWANHHHSLPSVGTLSFEWPLIHWALLGSLIDAILGFRCHWWPAAVQSALS